MVAIPRKPHRQGRPFPRGGGVAYLATPGLVASYPLWDGVGAAQSRVRADKLFPAGSGATWGAGRIGVGAQGAGGASDYFSVPNSAVSIGIKQPLPLSVELVFEPLVVPASTNALIWHNNANGTNYSGFHLNWALTTHLLQMQVGDGSGATSASRATWLGTEVLAVNEIYHVIASAGAVGAANGELFVNGRLDPTSFSGTGAAMGYNSSGNGFCICGGGSATTEAFAGRVYLLNYFNRRIFAAEAEARFNNLFRDAFALQLAGGGALAPRAPLPPFQLRRLALGRLT